MGGRGARTAEEEGEEEVGAHTGEAEGPTDEAVGAAMIADMVAEGEEVEAGTESGIAREDPFQWRKARKSMLQLTRWDEEATELRESTIS